MAWSDEPTMTQLAVVGGFIQWTVPTGVKVQALDFLKRTATRREVSYEIKRLRELYMTHRMSEDNVFDNEIWEGFSYEE